MLLVYLVKVNIVFTLLFIAYHFLLRKEKFLLTNRMLAWAILIVSFCLPLLPAFQVTNTTKSSIQEHTSNYTINKLANIVQTNVVDSASASDMAPASTVMVNWADLLAAVYITITIFMIIRLLIRIIGVIALLRKSDIIIKKDGLLYCKLAETNTPFSFFNFIVTPWGLEGEKYEQVLAHERAHCLQRHSFDLLLSDIMVALLWINPFIYRYKKDIILNLECLADHAVIAQGADAKSYQLNLLYHASNQMANLPVTHFSSRLGERIFMINKEKPLLINTVKYLMLLPIILLLSILIGARELDILPKEMVIAAFPSHLEKTDQLTVIRKMKAPIPTIKPVKAKVATDKPDSPTTIIRTIYINATSDTVRLKLTNETIAAEQSFGGIYVIGDQIFSDSEIRQSLKPTGELNFVLASRPKLSYYSAGNTTAIEKWGEQARQGAIWLDAKPVMDGE